MDNNEMEYERITNLLNKRDRDDANRRRKKTDWVGRMATILSFVTWIIMIAIWAVLDAAAPEKETRFITSFFDVHFGTAPLIRDRWDHALVYVAFILLLVSLSTCIIAFLFNKMRMKRKRDKYKKSIFIAGGITVIALTVFLLRFWPVLF